MAEDPWRQWREMLENVWLKSATAKPPAAEWLNAGLSSYLDMAERVRQQAQQFLQAAGGGAASGDAAKRFSEFLREQFSHLQPPWSATAAMPESWTKAAPWLQQIPWAAFAEQAGGTEQWRKCLDSAQRVEAAGRQLQQLWLEALQRASQQYAQRLAGGAPGGSVQALYEHWIDAAEAAYQQVAHHTAFAAAQNEYLQASVQWRDQAQALIEHWLHALKLPTPAEWARLNERVEALERALGARARRD